MSPSSLSSSSAASSPWPSRILQWITLLCILFARNSQALYFYIDGTTPKCFFEELPKDTLVVGHYTAELLNPQTHTYQQDPSLTIDMAVYEVFDNDHQVRQQRGSSAGRITFSAADSGEHRICFTPSTGSIGGGWLSGGTTTGPVKFTLDLVIGETSKIESDDKGKMTELSQKVRDLNQRLQDIKREQVFQREREAEFRDQSEATNSKIVRWTLIQLGVLGVTCAWQLSHLRAFFIKQKLT